MASEFNGQFTDMFTETEHRQVPHPYRSAPFMEDIVVTSVKSPQYYKQLPEVMLCY